jgi:hypothetical protein
VIVEIGDGVPDGYPGEGPVGKGKGRYCNGDDKEINELLHMGRKYRKRGYSLVGSGH